MTIKIDWAEYERRCSANQKAIEASTGPMTTDDLEKLGIMVYRQLKAEAATHGV